MKIMGHGHKRFKLILRDSKSIILIGRECQPISLERLYENSSYFWFLTVKSVGPDTNEQHSSFRASAEHISHSRSDLSKNCDEKKFQKIWKTCENIYSRLFYIYLHNFWPNTIDICCILLVNSSFWISHLNRILDIVQNIWQLT